MENQCILQIAGYMQHKFFFFGVWGVNTCVSLNPFEGLSFSVNLSDLVCPLNVKESILFYSVQ